MDNNHIEFYKEVLKEEGNVYNVDCNNYIINCNQCILNCDNDKSNIKIIKDYLKEYEDNKISYSGHEIIKLLESQELYEDSEIEIYGKGKMLYKVIVKSDGDYQYLVHEHNGEEICCSLLCSEFEFIFV